MAGLAYLLLPVSGLVAYLTGSTARTRFHGLQAIAVGLAWPLALYAASAVAPLLTQVVFVAGVALWVLLLIGAAAGRDPSVPWIGKRLRAAAEAPPRAES